MGILDRLFGAGTTEATQPDIKFGRYSDSYKEKSNYEAWNQSLNYFEQGEFLPAYRSFFKYLLDEEEQNVRFEEQNGEINFELYQGSMKITGKADRKTFKAEARIASTDSLNVVFMRRLIEKNFELKYSRFGLDPDNKLVMLFDTYSLDGSPYKLYYALKEVATHADKQDDLLLEEFQNLQAMNVSHLAPLPEEEKKVKYEYLTKKLHAVLEEYEQGKLDADKYPGGIAYLLLDVIYKLDYLTKPEGYTMETLERLHRQYFAKDGRAPVLKNRDLVQSLKKLVERPREDFYKEMYRGKSTFGITTPVTHDRVVSFIDSEMSNMKWYQDNGYDAVALAIPGYVVGYCLFNYALQRPDRDLFHLYYQVVEASFFNELGFKPALYNLEKGTFEKKAIRRAIDRVVELNRADYPRLRPAISSLNFRSLPEFAKSYLNMVKELDMSRID